MLRPMSYVYVMSHVLCTCYVSCIMYMDINMDMGMDVCGSDDTPGASLHVLALWVVEAYVACQATHIHIHIHIHNT